MLGYFVLIFAFIYLVFDFVFRMRIVLRRVVRTFPVLNLYILIFVALFIFLLFHTIVF